MVALRAIVDGVPTCADGRPCASPERSHHERDDAEGCPIGRDPRRMTIAELNAIGIHARPLLKAIRANCIGCMGGSEAEVRRCSAIKCAMWPYRMSTNPFHRQDLSDEQRERMRAVARQRFSRANESTGLLQTKGGVSRVSLGQPRSLGGRLMPRGLHID
jgi:hypothetical protein